MNSAFLRRLAACLFVVSLSPALRAAPPLPSPSPLPLPLPSNSVYQLPLSLTDQQGRLRLLAEHRGQPVLVSMFYTSCQFVCPMLIDALNDTEAKLSADERGKLAVLMVSFDPEHDTVAVLKKTADERQLVPAHWTLARTDAKSARKLAAVLGLQYKALPNGEFNHSSAVILLDAEGRIAGRSSQLGNADPVFVKLVKAAVKQVAP